MIGSLRGAVLATDPGELTLEVAGVGYRIAMPAASAARYRDGSTDAFVWIHHHQREDSQTLYGFGDREERDTFEVLIGTHGVGPALALAILSTLEPSALRRAVVGEDLAALCGVPGVGRKTAQRLLVELSTRFDATGIDLRDAEGEDAAPDGGGDLRDALGALGYRPDEIAAVMRKVPSDGDVADRLKAALAELSS